MGSIKASRGKASSCLDRPNVLSNLSHAARWTLILLLILVVIYLLIDIAGVPTWSTPTETEAPELVCPDLGQDCTRGSSEQRGREGG